MPPLLDDQEKNRRRSFGLYLQQELDRQKIKRTDLVERLRATGFQVTDCRVWWSRLIEGKATIPAGLPKAIEGILQCDTQKWLHSPVARLAPNQRVVLLSASSSSKRAYADATLAGECLSMLNARSIFERKAFGSFPINEGIPAHRLYAIQTDKDKKEGFLWQEHDALKIRRSWGLGESAPIASVEQCIDDHTIPILYKSPSLFGFKMGDTEAIPAKSGKHRFIVMTNYEKAAPLYERRLAACKALARVLVDLAHRLDVVERDEPDFDRLLAEALLLPDPAIELLLRDTFDAINQKALLAIEAIYGIPRKSVIARLLLTKKISKKHARALDFTSGNLPVLIKREKSIRWRFLDGIDFSRQKVNAPSMLQQTTLDFHIPPSPEPSSKTPQTIPTSPSAPATSSQAEKPFELECEIRPSSNRSIRKSQRTARRRQ